MNDKLYKCYLIEHQDWMLEVIRVQQEIAKQTLYCLTLLEKHIANELIKWWINRADLTIKIASQQLENISQSNFK